jgi:hypothetical protein
MHSHRANGQLLDVRPLEVTLHRRDDEATTLDCRSAEMNGGLRSGA